MSVTSSFMVSGGLNGAFCEETARSGSNYTQGRMLNNSINGARRVSVGTVGTGVLQDTSMTVMNQMNTSSEGIQEESHRGEQVGIKRSNQTKYSST